VADDDVPDAEPIDENPDDEFIGSQRRERGVESEHNGEIDAYALEDRQLLQQRRQVKVRLFGVEEFTRMRLENEGAGRRIELAPDSGSGAQQRLVAAMYAVEIADGEHGSARRIGHIPVAVNDPHRTSFRLSRVQILPLLLSMVAA
jgi:hypothetical protein